MIKIAPSIDLGNDKTRMKDPRDAKRQTATVEEILRRFFDPAASKRYEIQLLADEVGMGKTFVALATAYSVLESMRLGKADSHLDGCYQRVLIITPQNQALFQKWTQEVSEFVKRCAVRKDGEEKRHFRPVRVERLDDIVAELRKSGAQPDIIVTHTGVFQGGKLKNYDVKRRFLLGTLFRHWGVRFSRDLRRNLLKGAPYEWPDDPDTLTDLDDDEGALLPFTEDELYSALDVVARQGEITKGQGTLDELLETCREIAQPYMRSREELFRKVENRLVALYKACVGSLIRRDFPLVIVDEAHNWKNGPTAGANGYRDFARFVAPHTRRALLLTATPFQLRPQELLEILKVSDDMRPGTTSKEAEQRRQELEKHRERNIGPVLDNSAAASRRFGREWGRLSKRIRNEDIEKLWTSPEVEQARRQLDQHAQITGVIDKSTVEQCVKTSLAGIDPDLRPFLHEALCLYAFNRDLSSELSTLVIRHRRRTEHRLFRIGSEIDVDEGILRQRGDSHILHAAAGLDVHGKGELPHYLLMRCVTEMKRLQGRKGRSSLGSALTGCYSTLMASAEGKSVTTWLQKSPDSKKYLDLLMGIVGPDEDADYDGTRN